MKQTAVNWLIEQLKENNMLTFDEWTDLIDEAKQMEKEQIIEAADWNVTEWQLKDGEMYYNETFKSE